MKTLKKRLLSALCMVAICVCSAVAQTNTVQHTVDRGETLASIARRYATTEAKIIELNPDARQFVYVGMVLTIPVDNVAEAVNDRQPLQNDVVEQGTSVLLTKNPSNQGSQDTGEYASQKWSFGTGIAYGFLPKAKTEGASANSFAFSYSLSAKYNFTKSFYVGAGLGYSFVNSNMSVNTGIGQYMNLSSDTHFIFIPLEIGYRFYLIDNKVALTPYAGLDINYAVHCTAEEGVGKDKEKKSVDLDNRLGVKERIGLRLSLCSLGLGIGGSYVFATDDNFGVDDGYPEVSVSFEF